MVAFRTVLVVLMLAAITLSGVSSGYHIGANAENTTELDSELERVEGNYTEAEANLTAENYSALENTTSIEWLRPLEKTYYDTVIRSVYWGGRVALGYGYAVTEATARGTYRYL